ncbi:DNA-directed RNA polymerase subunit P [Caldiplasma sukawensis]
MQYRCVRCGRILDRSIGSNEIECECGSRIFLMERPSVEKVVNSR